MWKAQSNGAYRRWCIRCYFWFRVRSGVVVIEGILVLEVSGVLLLRIGGSVMVVMVVFIL